MDGMGVYDEEEEEVEEEEEEEEEEEALEPSSSLTDEVALDDDALCSLELEEDADPPLSGLPACEEEEEEELSSMLDSANEVEDPGSFDELELSASPLVCWDDSASASEEEEDCVELSVEMGREMARSCEVETPVSESTSMMMRSFTAIVLSPISPSHCVSDSQ